MGRRFAGISNKTDFDGAFLLNCSAQQKLSREQLPQL